MKRDNGNLLDHLIVSKSLKNIVSEKGESVTRANWATHSQFGVVLNAFSRRGLLRNDALTTEIAKSDLLICDDGAPEIADFIWIQPRAKKILLIHAKAKDEAANVSAANLETVGRQAAASLAFIGSSRTPLAFPTHWPNKIKIKNRKTKRLIQTIDRIHCRNPTTAREAHLEVVAALADPTYVREVWVVTAEPFWQLIGVLNRMHQIHETALNVGSPYAQSDLGHRQLQIGRDLLISTHKLLPETDPELAPKA